MKREPFTLLGRTAVALGVLMIVSQLFWMICAVYFVILPIKQMYQRNISAAAILAKELVSAQPKIESIQVYDNFRIVADNQPKPQLSYELHGFVPELQGILQKCMGPGTLVYKEHEEKTLWIQFIANDRIYWVVVPKGFPPLPGFIITTICIIITISVLGAYLIIYSITKELRKATYAVSSVGKGNFHAMLEETGSREIRDLNRGINQMVSDLKKLDDDRRLMLAGISHDLKTPLTRLRIAVDLAATHAEPEIATGIIRDIEDMDAILIQFLDYARDGKQEPLALHNLNDLVKEVCERYQMRGGEIRTSFGEIPLFLFRPLAISRAITNVIDNAVKYGQIDIEVMTRRKNRKVEIVVVDRGPGIKSGNPADYIKAFARENSARSETSAGLGFTIVNRIIQTHKGDLFIENRNPTGLLVKMSLPIEGAKSFV